MDYLLLQILLFLILAAVVGFFIGWLTRGYGFESRLLASENQWRAKHHVLQDENDRLQSKIVTSKRIKDQLPAMGVEIEEEETISLPFRSTYQAQQSNEVSATDSSLSHPLEKLRSSLNDIDGVQIENDSGNTQTFEESLPGSVPVRLDFPEGAADDLKRISGISPNIETTLNNLGIYHFHQIAGFTQNNVDWVNGHLRFKDRIERQNWVTQAKELVLKPNE